MSSSLPPPLHMAVWEGDIERVKSLLNCVCPEGEERTNSVKAHALKDLLELKDVRGNSALHLAVRVVQPSQRAIVRILLQRDANVASRNCDGWSCAHDASLLDDELLLAQLYLRGETQVIKSLESAQDTFTQALEKLPDFEAEIFIEAHSWVPIVSSVLPSDTIRIWKKGSQLRIDSALKGLDGVKWKKGPMSHVYIMTGERAGHAVVMDHESKRFYDVLEAMHNSSVGNLDLALQVALTTAMSSSSMDASNLKFIKQREVKAQKKRDESKIVEDEEKKSRSRLRRCPWPGTTYKMQNFSMEAQFRPVVNPDRKLKQLPTGKDTPFEEVQQFVEHLQSSVPYGKNKKGSKSKRKENSSLKNGNSNNENAEHRLQLDKGRKMEMHLEVIAGDTIRWNFFSKSSDFCFMATYYHEDQQEPVCRTEGVKNMNIEGSFQIEQNGSFVLKWQNTQKGFIIDRSGIKIEYNVDHLRSAVEEDPAIPEIPSAEQQEATLATSPKSAEDKVGTNEPHRITRLTDEQKCEVFRQPDHVPNPTTTTTSFVDYFMLRDVSTEPKENVSDNQQGSKKKPSFFKMFEDKKPSQQRETSVYSSDTSRSEVAHGMKNTFRSLTLVPETRRVKKDFEAKVVMTDSFPFQLRDFLPVITFISTTGEHVKNLEEFFQMTLPPGFPVKFELPMMFTIRVAYTFQKITLNPQLEDKMFEIPSDYHEVFTLDEVRL